MRRSPLPIVCALVSALACRSAPRVPIANTAAIIEGQADAGAVTDTTDERATVSLVERARWTLRTRPNLNADFWSDIALLDVGNAEVVAQSVEQRTFAVALRTLMDGQPEASAVAFELLRGSAKDSLVRTRSRVGLTMALSYNSDWSALARIEARVDSAVDHDGDPLAIAASVERWARALSMIPMPEFSVPDGSITLPMRRSAFGTPVITVKINGRPHEFWLDTGASMTLLSADIALDAGVKLAARDTLALGVVAGHIEARAVFLDSLSIGPVVVRRLGAALVSPEVLRFDSHVVDGAPRKLPIAGMIGTDVLRHLDIVLDAGAETITIRRPRRLRQAAERNLFWIGYPVVRLVTRDGRPLLFGLDTGAEATYVTSTLLKKLPSTRVAARRVTMTGLGSEKKNSSWVAREVPLSDGTHALTLRHVPIMPAQRWTFVDFDGVIGSDVALATRMHLDFTNGVFDIRNSAGRRKTLSNSLEGVKVF